MPTDILRKPRSSQNILILAKSCGTMAGGMRNETGKADGVAPPWVDLDWDLRCRDGRLLQLRDYWDSKRGGRLMPRRQDIKPAEIVSLLPNVLLVDVEKPLRLRYRLIGTRIAETMGRDSTGKYYDEIYDGELLEDIYFSFRHLIDRRQPLRTFGEAFYEDKNIYSYETMNLPLSDGGDDVDRVLGMIVFHFGPPA